MLFYACHVMILSWTTTTLEFFFATLVYNKKFTGDLSTISVTITWWWWWWWWWIVFVVWLTDERLLALFPAGTIVRDPHHCESLTYHKQDLNQHRSWVQALLNEFVQQWKPLHHDTTLTVLLFWIYIYLLTLVFVLQRLSLHWEILITFLSQFS